MIDFPLNEREVHREKDELAIEQIIEMLEIREEEGVFVLQSEEMQKGQLHLYIVVLPAELAKVKQGLGIVERVAFLVDPEFALGALDPGLVDGRVFGGQVANSAEFLARVNVVAISTMTFSVHLVNLAALGFGGGTNLAFVAFVAEPFLPTNFWLKVTAAIPHLHTSPVVGHLAISAL